MNEPKLEETGVASVCYICSLPDADSRDHVVPDCFFAGARPDNLVTLRAHHKCHNRLDEAYARDVLAGLGSDSSDAARVLWYDKVKRSIERSAPLRSSIRVSLIAKIDLISPNGLYFDQAPAFRIDRDRFYPSMRKIVQGLYALHTGKLLPPNFRSIWNLNAILELDIDRKRFLDASAFGLVYPGVFGCRYLVLTEGHAESSIWWLCFCNNIVLRCFVPTRDRWSPLLR